MSRYIYMCIHICAGILLSKKHLILFKIWLIHVCVFFSSRYFGILQWVMLIDHCHLIALESLKQEVYTQLGVITWQIYIALRNESALAFVMHVLIKQNPSMNVKTKLRNFFNHENTNNWHHFPHLEMWVTRKWTMKWFWLTMIMIVSLIWLEKVMSSLSLHPKIMNKKCIIIYYDALCLNPRCFKSIMIHQIIHTQSVQWC